MDGERKFELARDAVEQALRMLHPEDRFTLVVYDEQVDVLVPLAVQGGPDDGLDRRAHRQGVGQHDGCLDGAQLLNLSRAGEFAKSVSNKDCARNFFAKEIAAVWKNRSNASANVVAANESRISLRDRRLATKNSQRPETPRR